MHSGGEGKKVENGTLKKRETARNSLHLLFSQTKLSL
jgi:hypothetical protein